MTDYDIRYKSELKDFGDFENRPKRDIFLVRHVCLEVLLPFLGTLGYNPNSMSIAGLMLPVRYRDLTCQ